MHRRFQVAIAALSLLVLLSPSPGLPAQAPGQHPLRPGDNAGQPDAAGPFIRPQRKASERQRESLARTRQCGQEWRALKAGRRRGEQDWRAFSRECRERLKARGH
ncbi:MAG: hypothetical protein O9315_17625 [Beijerinckiaceae bacterium]|nr:hypothetical protein [Brevundimonas sp.]MCZ8302064.1 hypothetical protein [Beijerinckiaceae bacterium]